MNVLNIRGAAGYTPILGTDYWTTEDREAIANNVSEEVAAQLAGKTQLAHDYDEHFTFTLDRAAIGVLRLCRMRYFKRRR